MAAYSYFSVDSTGMAKTQFKTVGSSPTNARFVVGSRGSITDRGIGMPKSAQSSLNRDFIRRAQASNKTNGPTRVAKGVGLKYSAGSAIAKAGRFINTPGGYVAASVGAYVGGYAIGAGLNALGRRRQRRMAARATMRRQMATAGKRAGTNGRGGGSSGGGGRRRIRRDSHGRFA